MALSESAFVGVIREISSTDARRRTEGADRCVDVLRSYSTMQVRALATVLSVLTVIESSSEALEAQLNALLELGQTGLIRREDVASIENIDPWNLSNSLTEYVDDLLEQE